VPFIGELSGGSHSYPGFYDQAAEITVENPDVFSDGCCLKWLTIRKGGQP
jgi:hypothetical protein